MARPSGEAKRWVMHHASRIADAAVQKVAAEAAADPLSLVRYPTGHVQVAEVVGSLGGGGAAVSLLQKAAEAFSQPWQGRLLAFAPLLAVFFAAVWPPFLRLATRVYSKKTWPREQAEAVRTLTAALHGAKELEATLADGDAKEELKLRIAGLEKLLVRTTTAVPLTYPWKQYSGPIGGAM